MTLFNFSSPEFGMVQLQTRPESARSAMPSIGQQR
jgi:hypothetical protein